MIPQNPTHHSSDVTTCHYIFSRSYPRSPAIKHNNFCDSPSDDFPSYKPPCIAECHQSMRDFCTHNHNIDGHTLVYPTMFDFQGFPLVI